MTIKITLPDNSQKTFDQQQINFFDIAKSISTSLAKSAVAAKIFDAKNNKWNLVDLSHQINQDETIAIVTDKDAEGLEIIRHSTAHLMGAAVQELFPDAQVTIGPVIENGFYYDFAYKRTFTPEDLVAIEKKMHELAKQNIQVQREVWQRDDAVKFFKSIGEHYKAEIIASIPAEETITLYKQGNFVDLCRGPHVPSTGKLKAFKLTKVAGAYWRGDSKNEMLQRIYGTAWATKEELKDYLTMLAEAEKRDHRKLGAALDYFHFQEEAPGSVFWHPKGWSLFQSLISYMRIRQQQAGYVEVNTPDVMDRALWERSGHWFNYRENMFTTTTEDERIFALKPMNCPGAVALFAHGLKSYRDLPLRMAEFGKVHRYEPSGALHGLLRVRHFTQDDAHIFCTEEQMEQECKDVVRLIMDIYKDFGFENIRIKLSTRPENRIGSDELWDKLENALSTALDHMQMQYEIFPGEGAFYGPKLEFVLRDAIGRDWQCGTLQVDMNLPERFDVSYVAEDNTRKRPVMLHRALFGSLERFTGILIENYAGALPVWLSPVQAVVMSISEKHVDYAKQIHAELLKHNIKAELDCRDEKIGYKIREHSNQRIPYKIVVGDEEKAKQKISVKSRGNVDLGAIALADFVKRVQSEIAEKK